MKNEKWTRERINAALAAQGSHEAKVLLAFRKKFKNDAEQRTTRDAAIARWRERAGV